LDFGNCLAALVAAAPDPVSKSAVRRAVKMIYKHHGLNTEQKRDVITKSLLLGSTTYNELVSETGIRKPQIIAIVKDMVDAGDVELRSVRHGSGPGRPTLFIHIRQLNTPQK